jgi:hypothetical protein
MKSKEYKPAESNVPKAEEPAATYGSTIPLSDKAVVSNSAHESSEELPEGFEASYARLKAEADEKFGKKKRMTVDEYFGKLWYIVNGLYENI